MVQYSVNRRKNFHGGNSDIYEVFMVADKFGNIINDFGSTSSSYSEAGNLSGQLDAFGRIRQSTPNTLFDSKNVSIINNKFADKTVGSGSVVGDYNESTVYLSTGTASGNRVIRQSKRNFSYQPGKSLLILNTFAFSLPQAGLLQRVGYFNENDGIFLEQSTEGLPVLVLRSSTTGTAQDQRVLSTDWNCDKLDGSGKSGIVLDLSMTNIFFIDIEWLGVGSVRCGFVINGQYVVTHIFHNANINDKVYMRSPDLPIRYEIENIQELAVNANLKQICSTVISEGGYDARAVENVFGTSLSGNNTQTANTFVNLVTIKMRNNFAGQEGVVVPSGVDILNIANADFEWGLFLNATPDSAFSYTNATQRVEYSTSQVNLSNIGTRVAGGYMGGKTAPFSLGNGGFNWDYQLGRDVDLNSDTLTLAVRASSTSKAAAGLMKWFEL